MAYVDETIDLKSMGLAGRAFVRPRPSLGARLRGLVPQVLVRPTPCERIAASATFVMVLLHFWLLACGFPILAAAGLAAFAGAGHAAAGVVRLRAERRKRAA